MTTVPVPSSVGQEQQPYIRLATIGDLKEIVDSGSRAFIHDPPMNYFGNVKKVRLRFKPENDCSLVKALH